jgi:RNA polymerase sigma-70 factor, ECF subfamily
MSTRENRSVSWAKNAVSEPEVEAIQRAKSGDSAGFEYLYNLHRRHVYGLCLRMTTNSIEAEDLTQDTFLQVFRKIQSFRGDSGFSTWLHRVTINVVLMRFRMRKRVEVSLDEPRETSDGNHGTNPGPGCEDLGLSGTIDRIVLERALERLPDGYKQMFVLHDIQGYEHHEIASILGCSVGNCKSQLHKARLRMRTLVLEQVFHRQAHRKAAGSGASGTEAKARRRVTPQMSIPPQEPDLGRKPKDRKHTIGFGGFMLSPAKA